MNTMNVLDIPAKVRRVVDLVLKKDARDFVSDEIGRLVRVVGLEEEVVAKDAGLDRDAEVARSFQTGVSTDSAPHLDGVRGEAVFAGAFLVFAVGAVEQSFCLCGVRIIRKESLKRLG
jgi:hypothetical protein